MKTVPIDVLRHHLRFEPETGTIYWIVPSGNRAVVGAVAGSTQWNGYKYLQLCGVRLRCHNVAWALTHGEWPATKLDHKNRVRGQNLVENLRLSTASLDARNTARSRRPASGYRGVYLNNPAGLYQARTNHNYTEISLGYFKDPKDAAKAYDDFVREHVGEGYPTNASLGWLS